MTIFYCLRFETSLTVSSYDSQGHGGGIRPHLHTGKYGAQDKSQTHIATDITVSLWGTLSDERPLPSNSCCPILFEVPAQQRVYMPQYLTQICKSAKVTLFQVTEAYSSFDRINTLYTTNFVNRLVWYVQYNKK
jgi:hypothetical protein